MGLRKKILFVALVFVSIVTGAVAAKLHSRWATREAKCLDVPCPHLEMRLMAIESVIRQRGATPSYLAIGDSITELADLPPICGRIPINAGIGWATVETFETDGRRIAELARPDFIVVALGTNDAYFGRIEGFKERLSSLLSSLGQWRIILVPVPPSAKVPAAQRFNSEIATMTVPRAAELKSVTTTDGIHLSSQSYVDWKQSIVDRVTASICG
jgi:hypothetical protein